MEAPAPEPQMRVRRIREIVVLLALFVAPGVAAPTPATTVVFTISSLVALAIRNVAFALLVVYILDVQEESALVRGSGPALRTPGIAIRALALCVLLLVVSIVVGALFPSGVEAGIFGTDVPRPERRFLWLPLLVIAMVSVGIVEELFFRAYLIERLKQVGGNRITAVIVAATLFSIGHGYQGVAATVFSFLAGLVLGYAWIRLPVLPVLIAGHTAYNLVAVAIAWIAAGRFS